MEKTVIRTTAFRLAREHFGRVYVYRRGPRFTQAWAQLENQWRRTGDVADLKRLPYGGLTTALRVLSGDFVALERRVFGSSVFAISRSPISEGTLAMAVGAWEVHALGLQNEPIGSVLDDLSCDEVDVADQIQRRPGLCPAVAEGANWVWDVAVWEVAHRMASMPMETDNGRVRLRLDSDAALLTWDRLVGPEQSEDARAMHKTVLNLMTIPGIEEPVVSMQSGLVRLAPSWREARGARYAWAELTAEGPILRGRVRTTRKEAGFNTFWADRAVEVLRGVNLEPLPSAESELSSDGALRTGYRRQPSSHKIGRGVGTWFHECIAHHGNRVLGPSARCVELESSRPSWPRKKRIAPRVPLGFDDDETELKVRLVVVYASASVRRRVRDALAAVLTDDADHSDGPGLEVFLEDLRDLPDGTPLRRGPIEARFIKPPSAEPWLLQRHRAGAIEEWLASWMVLTGEEGVATAALVETDETASNGKDELADPKQVLRAALARRGIVSQFVTAASAPDVRVRKVRGQGVPKDHAAVNAVYDLMRSAGFFLRPFPKFEGDENAVVVGVYGTRVTSGTTGRRPSYLVNLVAVSLGSRDAWGYVDKKGWVPIDEATAWFLGTDHVLTDLEARKRVERAVGQLPLVLGDRRAILLFDALGCRRFWPCLTDKSGERTEAWMRRNGTAVVRVRAVTSEVPRPAGVGCWADGFQPARHTDFRPMSVPDAQGSAPVFVLSGSAVMSQGQSARKSTRFSASPRGLKEDWHSLGTTELLVTEAGTWSSKQLTEQVAMLCRVAPTWNGTLRWPSPLHLARAIVRDHPHDYFADGEEEEEQEDNRQMRFDFGIY